MQKVETHVPKPADEQTTLHLFEHAEQVIDSMNPRVVQTVVHHDEKLKQRLFHLINQLERMKLQLAKFNDRQVVIGDIANSDFVKEDLFNLKKVEDYKKSLMSKTNELESQYKHYQNYIEELKFKIFERRVKIRDLARDVYPILDEQAKQEHKEPEIVFLTQQQQSVNEIAHISNSMPKIAIRNSKIKPDKNVLLEFKL